MEQLIRSLPRIVRFCFAGGLSTGVNVVFMLVFVELLKMDSFILKNLANVLAMGIGAISAFFLHRAWTWEDSVKLRGMSLVKQFARFVGSLSVGVGSRIGMFSLLDYIFSIDYLLNVVLGIACAATIDYFLYEKLVFKTKV
jgi:putative flippase GtrA